MTLDQLAIKHGTDKSSKHHNYTKYYERHFYPLREDNVTLLEIGYGGYEYENRGGESAKMWLDYFSKAEIVVTDIHHKNAITHPRFRFVKVGQDSRYLLSKISPIFPDIIIDDASHICDLTLKTFQILFPILIPGGWYVIEDIEGSFWDTWSGGTKDFEDFKYPSPVNLGRKLINDVNAKFIPNYTKQYDISEIHFYQNIIFIRKK